MSIYILALLVIGQVITFGPNYIDNPSFEDDLKNWYTENKVCAIDTNDAHTGTKSLHCNKQTGDKNGFIAQWKAVQPGLYYKMSGYFKIKKMDNLKIMFYAEANGGKYGLWAYPTCEIPCTDTWQYYEYKSVMTFDTSSNFQYGIQCYGNGTGEFWIDDLKLEQCELDILRSCEVLSYKQEVFEEEVEVVADCLVDQTRFSEGQDLLFKLEVISQEDSKTYMTIKEWTFEKRTENYVAVFKMNPKDLNPGFYTLKVTLNNTYYNGKIETTESNMHKLKEKIIYKRYIDKSLRTIEEDGRPFFPLGIYTYTSALKEDDEEIKALADSQLNLIIGESVIRRVDIDAFYNKTNKQIRVITILGCIKYNTSEERLNCTRNRVNDLKDSPGLFGYYLVDEPAVSRIPAMREITLLIRELDPHHFVYAAINQRLSYHLFKEGVDVLGSDDYPVQHYDALRSIVIVARQGRERLINSRAMWNIPQFFDWTCNGYKNESSPTKKQLRHMTYQYLVGGGNGLIWYSYGEMKRTDYKVPIEVEFQKLKDVMNEIVYPYLPIIYSGQKNNPSLKYPKNEDYMCYVRFYRYSGYDYILAVNAWDTRKITCKFSTSKTSRIIKQLAGDSYIRLKDGVFNFVMPIMDIVWLKVKDDNYTD